MKNLYPRLVSLLVILVAILTLLFFKAEAQVSSENEAFITRLRGLRELDGRINLTALSSRFGLVTNYDSLTRDSAALRDSVAKLNVPVFIEGRAASELGWQTGEYRQLIARKLDLVEHFKSENATLRNSLAYFPVAAERFNQKLNAQGPPQGELANLDRRIDALLQGLLIYIQTSDNAQAERLLAVIVDIEDRRGRYPKSIAGQDLSNVLLHARTLLRSKPAADRLTRDLTTLPTDQINEGLFRTYSAEYDRRLIEANRYRVVLYLIALVLAGYIVAAVIKLRLTSQQLKASNGELEQRMAEQLRAEEALRTSEERYRMLFNSAHDAILVVTILPTGMPGRFIEVNDVACQRLGYSREELLKLNPVDIEPVGQHLDLAEIGSRLQKSGHLLYESEQISRDGHTIPVEISAHLFEFRGTPTVLSIVRDISQRRKDEQTLRLFAEVFRGSTEGIVVTDPGGRIMAVNQAFTAITGYSEDEIRGQTPAVLRSGRQDSNFYRQMWQELKASGRWRGEIWNRRKSGEVYPEWLSISSLRDPQGEASHYVAIFSDITERKRNEERIHYLAHHDALTGLPNRVLLQDRLAQAIARARRSQNEIIGLMFVDLDRFKNINDTLGHDCGDAVLQLVSERLTTLVRQVDTVSRQGGDEFVIILPHLSHASDAGHVAQKVISGLSEAFTLEGHELTITASIGISLYPSDGDTPWTLMRNADTAMYRAKSEGRNGFCYYSADMNAASLERLTMESYLRRALERDELHLLYQPQFDLANGRITGVEALIRWQSLEMGRVMPDKFIPLAEETGLIVAMGAWVLRTACAQAKAWRDVGYHLRMAVNLSARQFAQDDLVDEVARILEETGLKADDLELELTESILMVDLERGIHTLSRLKSMGVHLAVDDFGTGYSSLSYLQRFPIDRLKIDRSFVLGVDRRHEDETIAAAVVVLAHTLELEVVAEGVETQGQFRTIERLGANLIQGNFISCPVPAEKIVELLKRQASLHASLNKAP